MPARATASLGQLLVEGIAIYRAGICMVRQKRSRIASTTHPTALLIGMNGDRDFVPDAREVALPLSELHFQVPIGPGRGQDFDRSFRTVRPGERYDGCVRPEKSGFPPRGPDETLDVHGPDWMIGVLWPIRQDDGRGPAENKAPSRL